MTRPVTRPETNDGEDPVALAERPILTIDTSSSQGCIALYDGERLSTRSWPAGRSHTTTLVSEIHHLLAGSELSASQLAAIAIATGPGAFTGLRVGFGVAKGLHLAIGAPLIGIPTLDATALPFAICGIPVVAAVSAGRGRLAWARYERNVDHLHQSHGPRNGTLHELADELSESGSVIVTGEITADQADVIAGIDGVILPPAPLRARRPAAFAALAWSRWRAGSVDDASAIEPLYLAR